MNNRLFIFCIAMLLLSYSTTFSQTKPVFKVVPLGVLGGSDESNLSAYMLAPVGSNNFICLDAGTVKHGIDIAEQNHAFDDTDAESVLKRYIKAYFISHAHLDHVSGLIMNSPDDIPKNVYGLPYTLNVLRDNYFTWKNWANFGSDGDKPVLNKYIYTPMVPTIEVPIPGTEMSVQAITLSHGNPYESTAFLVRRGDNYLLYLGDTGADQIENSNKLQLLWQQVAQLVKRKKLRAIMIEVSFPNEQPSKQLFGHLTPDLLMHEMEVLARYAGAFYMKDLPIVITHIKPSGHHEETIKKQLNVANTLQLKLIIPEQGKMLEF